MPRIPAFWTTALFLLVLGTAACSSAVVTARALSEEERCMQERGIWRVGRCETCGGGM
jgi:hypothetical protein